MLKNSIIQRIVSKTINAVFNIRCRKRYKGMKFTILCSNCIGGVIYNRLGLEFLSPTINLFLLQKDFIKLIRNPKNYMDKDLKFIETEYGFPIALLDDIVIYFNHAKDEVQAREEWDRRKQRIIWNNLYIIMYEKDDIKRKDLLGLSEIKCKKLIVLTENTENLDIPYMKYIKPCTSNRANKEVFLDKDLWGIRTFEKQWDFVKWLST